MRGETRSAPKRRRATPKKAAAVAEPDENDTWVDPRTGEVFHRLSPFERKVVSLVIGQGVERLKLLQELKVENDMCIALVLLNKVDSPEGSPEGTEPTEEWEEVRIEEPGASEPAA